MTNGNDALDTNYRDRILLELSAKAGIDHLVSECRTQERAATAKLAQDRAEHFKQTDCSALTADQIAAAARRGLIGY